MLLRYHSHISPIAGYFLSKPWLHRSISILLLFLFLFNIGGYYIWFKIVQFELKEKIETQIKNGINEDDLTLIIVQNNDLTSIQWIEHGKEFSYHNEMFDVVKTKSLNNKIYLYCLNDKKEQQLLTSLTKSNKENARANTILKKMDNLKYLPIQALVLQNTLEDIPQFSILKVRVLSIPSETQDPPPKIT